MALLNKNTISLTSRFLNNLSQENYSIAFIIWSSFEWEVNIKSMLGEQFLKIWVGSLINCYRPNCEVMATIFEPLYVVLSCLYQFEDLGIKLARTTVRNAFWLLILSNESCKLSANSSKESEDWLGRLLSKHFCLQPFFHKDWVFLLFTRSLNLDIKITGKYISDTLFDFKAYVVHRW